MNNLRELDRRLALGHRVINVIQFGTKKLVIMEEDTSDSTKIKVAALADSIIELNQFIDATDFSSLWVVEKLRGICDG